MNVADSKTKKMKMKVEVGRHGESMIWANDVMLKDSSLLGNKRCHASFFRQPTILHFELVVCAAYTLLTRPNQVETAVQSLHF